jgi:plastocyanin
MTLSRHALVARGLGLGLILAGAVTLGPVALAAGPLDVSIVDRSFQPTDLTVKAGDTVTWTVTQAIAEPHSVKSGSPGDPDAGKLFDSTIRLRANGDSFQFTFANPGTYPFYCEVHPTTMKGTITVAGPGGSTQPAPGSLPPPSGNVGSPGPATGGGPGATAGVVPSGGPGSTGEPAQPPGSEREPVKASDKAIAAGVLGIALLVLFGSAVLYRRVNRG